MLRPNQPEVAPRHILGTAQYDESSPFHEKAETLPQVQIDHEDFFADRIIVVPQALDLLYEGVVETFEKAGAKHHPVATVNVSFPGDLKEGNGADVGAFDEQEQLYVAGEHYGHKQDTKSFSIVGYDATDGHKYKLLLVPAFQNKAVYNLIADGLTQYVSEDLLVLGTAELGLNGPLTQLAGGLMPPLSGIPAIAPPAAITGAAGAFAAKAAYIGQPYQALIVDAEGSFSNDMEKPNYDGVVAAARVLEKTIPLQSLTTVVQKRIKAREASTGRLYM